MKVTITLEDQDQGMSLDINYGGPKDATSHAAYMAGEFLRLLDEKAKPVVDEATTPLVVKTTTKP